MVNYGRLVGNGRQKPWRRHYRRSTMWILFGIAILIFLAGLALVRLSLRERQRTGLPQGSVVYSDTGAWQRVEQPLRSRRYGIVGKPDYLVEVGQRGRKQIIPVEVKSRRRPPVAYDSHILQLGAYCLLVEDVHGRRPQHGLLHYADATLEIPFTDELRWQVLETADAIRSARRARNVPRQHEDAGRCASCGYVDACGEEAL